MRAAFHHCEARRSSNGASYFYADTSKLLGAAGATLQPRPHDLFELLRADERTRAAFVQALGPQDVWVCNAGPYGHLVHALRELHGGRFRIVRDVRTSAWCGYLLQERLAGPLTRDGDRVLFPSEFCRRFFAQHLAGHAGSGRAVVSYPLAAAFPVLAPRAPSRQRSRLGYLGRVAADKGFAAVLEQFAAIRRDDPNATLDVAGHIAGGTQRSMIAQHLQALRVPASAVRYRGHLAYADIWPFLRGLDVLLFPAVASVESLGRVLLEACHAGVPAVAAAYAAAPEILPAANLVPPVFRFDETFELTAPFSFGGVATEAVQAAVRGCVHDPAPLADPRYQAGTYLSHVAGCDDDDAPPWPLAADVERFIGCLDIAPAAPLPSADEALQACAALLAHFNRYNDNALRARARAMWEALRTPPRFAHERQLLWHRLVAPDERLLPSHARAHCAEAGYRPTACLRRERWLQAAPPAAPLGVSVALAGAA